MPISVIKISDLIIQLYVIVLIIENRRENVLAWLHKLLILLRMFKLVIIHIYIIKKHILLLLNWDWKVLDLVIYNWV